jgi:NAD(P)-dependent dehydrogenase (short-subunit alcohol dehydrogenase family)
VPTVLVTGAGRGIGHAAALRLARAGWDVHAGVRRDEDGERLTAAAPAGRLVPVTLDVTDADQVAALDDALPEHLDGVVNNAGIVVGGPVEALALDDLRRQLEVNVVGQVAVTQAVLPRLRASRGRIVLVSSVGGRVASPMIGAYSASKFALEGLADALRIELRPWGIAVSLVEPGTIDTDMWRTADDQVDAIDAGMRPDHRALYAAHVAGFRRALPRIRRRAAPTDKVTAIIEDALTASRPRARYVVGTDAKVQLALHRALPTRAFDAMVSRLLGGGGPADSGRVHR